jgi:Molybdopterin oxidoreductase Fe4S4 domain/Molybdopterin oxidoreductase
VVDRVAAPWGERTVVGQGTAWPVRVDLQLEEGLGEGDVDRWVQSACVLCSHGCGLDVAVKDDRIVGVRGRAEDRVNRGRLGPKGLFGWQANNAADRLVRPLIRRDGELVETDWDTALGAVVERSRELLAEQGPLAVGFYTTGQLFLEEYYTQGVIGMAGIGTPHMDGNTPAVHGHRRPGPEGELRQRRRPRLLRGHQRLRHAVPGRAQRGRDPDRHVDADARPPARAGSAEAGGGRPAGHAGGPRGRPPPGDPQRHQPGPPQRHPARAARQRLGRPGVRGHPHRRLGAGP